MYVSFFFLRFQSKTEAIAEPNAPTARNVNAMFHPPSARQTNQSPRHCISIYFYDQILYLDILHPLLNNYIKKNL